MKYLIALSSLVLLFIACGNNTIEEQQLKPTPIDSTAKADSILKLKYDKTNWSVSIKELARWDSCKARQLDSVIMFVLKLPSNWGRTRDAIFGLDSLAYGQIYSYGRKIGDDYYAYLHNPPSPPQIVEPDYYHMTEKPVIYLYPTKEMQVNVKLDFNGTDLYTWPKVGEAAEWDVTARPDGMLTDTKGDQFPYLFWEGKQRNLSWIDNTSGFVVSSLSVETFLQEKLKVLGLNPRERADFITYWGPRMHKSGYYFIRFETVNYAKAIPLSITPAPTTMQRIMMVFAPLSSDRKVKEQSLTPFTRKGFTVIEWGGIELPSVTFKEF